MKVTALIVDDESISRIGLRDALAAIDWIQCIGEAANGPAAVEAINTQKPELVFLDIQMPGFSGIDVLRNITRAPFVIFTTAFAQHAVTAFELGALDYLLKPFGAERLHASLERLRAAIGEPLSTPVVDRLTESLAHGPMTRLFVRSGRTIIPVAVSSILYFEADGDYINAFAGGSKHVVHLALSRIEARLDPVKFVRIHRTHIVNIAHVKEFRQSGKTLMAVLTDGTKLPVSRTRARELRGLGA